MSQLPNAVVMCVTDFFKFRFGFGSIFKYLYSDSIGIDTFSWFKETQFASDFKIISSNI